MGPIGLFTEVIPVKVVTGTVIVFSPDVIWPITAAWKARLRLPEVGKL